MMYVALPLPPTSNSAYPTNPLINRRFLSAEGKAWKKLAVYTMKNKGVLTPPVKITYSFFFPDLRVRDHWNYTKLVTDALVEAGIIPDDRWTMNPHAEIKAALDKNNPRIEICVKEVEGDPMYLPI